MSIVRKLRKQSNKKKTKEAEDAVCFRLAVQKMEADDYPAAYELFLKARDAALKPGSVLSDVDKIEIFVRLGCVCLHMGRSEEAGKYYYSAYKLDKETVDVPECRAMALSGCLMGLVSGVAEPERILSVCRELNETLQLAVGKKPMKKSAVKSFDAVKQGKIHVAYLSPDFRDHVMYSFYYAFLAKYDREKFFVTCISLHKTSDACTDDIKSLIDQYVVLAGVPLYELAGRLRSMDIDILVDLAGHSVDSGLHVFAYRVAPVQISGLGWMETTGLDATDYLVTDRHLDPPEGGSYLTEKPLYLTSQFCYWQHRELPASVAAPCQEKGYITFGCFNRVGKITDEMLEVWRQVLCQVPESRLLIKCNFLSSAAHMTFFRARLLDAGLDGKRIELEPSTRNYMERYLDVDIALDTYPYAGGGTTFDALYMGVPVVTMYGRRRSSRFGLSILSNAGVGELVTSSPQEYIERAVALANDWDLLDVLHKNLRVMLVQSPAMDADRCVAELEAQYKRVLADAISRDMAAIGTEVEVY